jgi:hypothetical protein
MLPSDRQLIVAADGFRADMDMVVVQETMFVRKAASSVVSSKVEQPSFKLDGANFRVTKLLYPAVLPRVPSPHDPYLAESTLDAKLD